MSDESQNGVEDRKPTVRVVLELAVVLLVPEGASEAQIVEAFKVLNPKSKAKAPLPEVAWLEAARVEAATKRQAVESYAGKAGTSTAKVGTFRAPSLTSWKGAILHEAPPQPLVQASLID